MKAKTILKMFIDLSMFIIYLQLTFSYEANTLFHEIAGIAIGILFAIHVVLNIKPVLGMVRRLQKGKLPATATIQLVGDVLLVPAMIVTLVSGVLVAKDLFVGPGEYWIVPVHDIAAYTGLALMAVHLLLHARYLFEASRKLIKTKGFQMVGSVMGALMMVAILLWSELLSAGSPAIAIPDTLTATLVERSTTTTASYSGRETVSSNGSTSNVQSDSTTISTSDTSSSSDSGSGTVICTLCGKHCPISALRCGRGTDWAESAGYI